MKNSFVLLFVSLSFYSFSIGDTLKKKKLDFVIETGYGINTSNVIHHGDSATFITSSNRKRIGIGVFYSIDKEWKVYSTLEYYNIKVRQTLLLNKYNYPTRLKHNLGVLKLTAMVYHCLIHDDKSTLYVGLGFATNKHLNKTAKSDAYTLKINGEPVQAQLTSTPPSNFLPSVDLGLMYEYKFDKVDIGFKIDFTSYGAYRISYSYTIENNFQHDEYYIPNNFNMESSIFLKF